MRRYQIKSAIISHQHLDRHGRGAGAQTAALLGQTRGLLRTGHERGLVLGHSEKSSNNDQRSENSPLPPLSHASKHLTPSSSAPTAPAAAHHPAASESHPRSSHPRPGHTHPTATMVVMYLRHGPSTHAAHEAAPPWR